MAAAMMMLLTLLCRWQARSLVTHFTSDLAIAKLASQYIQLIALSFVAQGIAQTCSSVFQALGRTVGVLISSATQVCVFALGIPWLRGLACRIDRFNSSSQL
jgi:MATE family, multidrug efflux pump